MSILNGLKTDDSAGGTGAADAPTLTPETASVAQLLNDSVWADETPAAPAPADAPPATPEPAPVAADDAAAAPVPAEAAPTETSADAPATESDAAAAPAETTSPDAPADTFNPFDPATVERFMRENIELKRLKGRQGTKVEAANQEIARLNARLEAIERGDSRAAAAPPANAEDLAAQLLADPDSVIADRIDKRIAAISERQAAEETEAALAVAPEVGMQLVAQRFPGINPANWQSTPEFAAVSAVMSQKPTLAFALQAGLERGNPVAVAEALSEAIQIVRTRNAVAGASGKVAAERARVAAAKPQTLPPQAARPVPATPPPKSIYDISAADLLDPSKVSDADLLRLHA